MLSKDQAALAASPKKRIPPVDSSTRRKPVKFYKKNPEAPKRFKSAFIFFSTQKHHEIRNELQKKGESTKTTNVAKLVSEAWKKLNAEDRREWDEMALQDKIRYETEKSMYAGPWRVQTMKRTPKDPDAPKRPMSAFLAYSNGKRAGIKRQDPSLSNAEVSKTLSKMWKEAPKELKQKYIDEEFKLRQAYKKASADWQAEVAKKKRAEHYLRENDNAQPDEAHDQEHPQRYPDQLEPPHRKFEDDRSVARRNPAAQIHRQPPSLLAPAPCVLSTPLVSAYGQGNNPLFPYAGYGGRGLSLMGASHGIDPLVSYRAAMPLSLGVRPITSLPSMNSTDAARLASLQRLQQRALLQGKGEEFSNLLLMQCNSSIPSDELYLGSQLPGVPPPG